MPNLAQDMALIRCFGRCDLEVILGHFELMVSRGDPIVAAMIGVLARVTSAGGTDAPIGALLAVGRAAGANDHDLEREIAAGLARGLSS
jgi:hypothetical protein